MMDFVSEPFLVELHNSSPSLIETLERDTMSILPSGTEGTFQFGNPTSNSSLLWNEEALFLQQSPAISEAAQSIEAVEYEATSPVGSSIPLLAVNPTPVVTTKVEVPDVDTMENMNEFATITVDGSSKFLTISEDLNMFPKDQGALNEICSSLQLENIIASQSPTPSPSTGIELFIPPSSGMSQLLESTVTTTTCNIGDDVRTSLENALDDHPRGRRRSVRTRHLSHVLDDNFCTDHSEAKSFLSHMNTDGRSSEFMAKRRRYNSEMSVLSTGSFDDSDGNGRRKRRRYEEEPSDDPAFEKSRKNAIIAKRNREKKKQIMEELEGRVDKLTSENDHLETENIQLKRRVGSLEEEVYYLKSILANQSALAQVLSSLQNAGEVRLTTSFEASRNPKKPTRQTNGQFKVSGGVCLHVDGSQVSVEMCHKCSQMAKGAPRNSESSFRQTKRSA